ncbi:MAG: peptidase [Methanomicrobiales archaeon HGW-Methanomicrobiales-3]|nr:MAG: peptidase [Methanomicrobiales archaeon HGW-Methanomicrobiales-3]
MPLQTCPSCIVAAAILVILFVSFTGCLQESAAPTPASGTAAPPALIRSDYQPGEITRLTGEAREQANASLTAIATIPAGQRTFKNTVLAFDTVMTDYSDATTPLTFMGYVHLNKEIAREAMAAEEASAIFGNDIFTRRDLYNALKDGTPSNSEESRLYDITIREFTKNGMNLPDDRLAKVRQMNDELSALESRFSANLNNEDSFLIFTETELAGVPAETIAAFAKNPDGKYRVTTKYPDYVAVIQYADNSTTRQAMFMAYNNRQAETNTPLLEQALILRQSIARELGYPTWADYKTDGRMAKNSENVRVFIDTLKAPLHEKVLAENAVMLRMKQEQDSSATALDAWDVSYLQEKLVREQYSYDPNVVKEYFPVDTTIHGIFGVYGELFGIEFEEVKGAPAWSPDVQLFRVTNTSDGVTVGYLYLDLYPREGKYGHFAAFPLITSRMKDGARSVPVMAIVGNFPAPAEGKPGLLTMWDIETVFHEGGHAMHFLLTTAPYGSLGGFNTELDFVETPSQSLEEWAWDPAVLSSLSGHYANSSQKIPPELLDRIIAARDVGAGHYYARQVANTIEDTTFHTADGPVDVTNESRRIYAEMTGIPQPEGIHHPASFSHLMGGYDAGYYGYLWSKVYAMEITGEFKRDGMTNQTTGMRYRQEILSKGNMQDGGVLLFNFLGREPGPGAFYERLGIRQE